MVSGNTKSLNYAGNDGTCDYSWLAMLLGNAHQFPPKNTKCERKQIDKIRELVIMLLKMTENALT